VRQEDLRQYRRYAVAETFLRVTWLDASGDLKVENGTRPINVSEKGMAVELPQPALLLSRIRMESEYGEFLGHGKVRSCRPSGEKFIVGIEFADSLRWTAPDDPVQEPIPLSAPPSEEELAAAQEAAPPEAPEALLWSDALSERASKSSTPPPFPDLHWSLGSTPDQGFFARLPIAVKAGALVLVVMVLCSAFFGHGRTVSGSAGHATASIVGEQGWLTEWASDEAGSRRGRQLTLYRPSVNLSDYQMQFTGQIESKAIGWVIRAEDTKNYYAMKIESDAPGSVQYTRFAVVHGKQSLRTEKRLPIAVRADTAYNVKVEANGPHFSAYIQSEPVDLWTDNRLKTGAVGFLSETGESGRSSNIHVSFPDTIGR